MIKTIRDLMNTARASTAWANAAELPEARQSLAAVAAILTEAGCEIEQTADSLALVAGEIPAGLLRLVAENDLRLAEFEAELAAKTAGDQEPEIFQFRFLARTGADSLLPLFGRDSTGRNTETPTRSGVRLEFDFACGRNHPEGTAWVVVFASGRSVSEEEVQALFPEVAWFPAAAQPGDLVRVDRDMNILADPQGFGTWENFKAAVDAAGLELDQHPGTDAEGWRVVAVSPRTGPNRPEGEDGPPPPDPALERVWID